jgi:hypothetical protein
MPGLTLYNEQTAFKYQMHAQKIKRQNDKQ